jgi:RES domain-containing protein
MRLLWRISNHCDLEGLGGEKADGRWHTAARGKRIVYFSEHPALALVEVLANLGGTPGLFPDAYQLMKVSASDGVSAEVLEPNALPDNWRDSLAHTRSAGDSWLQRGNSALLGVPSVPSPESTNYLFNPRHPEANDVAFEWCRWIKYDKRLFHLLSASSA